MLKKRLTAIHSLASILFISFIIAIADDRDVFDFINYNLQKSVVMGSTLYYRFYIHEWCVILV
jgi:hypothetical protein